MERLGEARIVRRLMTIRTGRRRAGKLRQVRRGQQTRDRAGMTDRTGTAVDTGDDLAAMTAGGTIAHLSDRSVVQAAGRVRRMVVVAVALAGLVGMTGSTGVARTRGDHTLYRGERRVVVLTVATVILMTGRTAVEVMQRNNLTPGADRCMTGITCIAAICLVCCTTVKCYVMRAR